MRLFVIGKRCGGRRVRSAFKQGNEFVDTLEKSEVVVVCRDADITSNFHSLWSRAVEQNKQIWSEELCVDRQP